MRRTLLALAAWMAMVSCGWTGDWPQFRGRGAEAVAGDALPTEWSGEKNLLWTAKLPGPGASSPITYGDRIYVTCYTGFAKNPDNPGNQEDLVRHLICMDRNGKELWNTPLHSKSPEARYQGQMTQHGYASNTPATDGERIYVFLGTGGVAAVDLQGKELWRTPVGDGTDKWGSGSSVVLTDKLAIVSAAVESGSLIALHKADGKEAWRLPIPRQSWSTPAVVAAEDGRQEVVVSGQGKIIGVDPANGKELWRCAGIDDYTCPSVIPGKGVAYIGGGRQSRIIAVRTGGSGDVTDSHVLWNKRIGGNVTTALLHGDHLFGVSDRGIAYCVEARTGDIAYQVRLAGGEAVAAEPDGPRGAGGPRGPRGPGGPGGRPGGRRGPGGGGGFGRGGGFGGGLYASLVAAGDKLYAVTRTTGTVVYDATPEFKVVSTNTIDSDKSRFDATPAISDSRLYLRSNEALYCVGNK